MSGFGLKGEEQRLATPDHSTESQPPRRAHSGVEDLQRTAGNARLVQMRSAVQSHPSEPPAWLKDSGTPAAGFAGPSSGPGDSGPSNSLELISDEYSARFGPKADH